MPQSRIRSCVPWMSSVVESAIVASLLVHTVPAAARDLPSHKFYARVHTVALAPCEFARAQAEPAAGGDDPLVPLMEAFRARLDSLLVLTFEDSGIRVVPGMRLISLRDSLVTAGGEASAADSGVTASARLARASAAARSEITSRSHPDAWVETAIVVRQADVAVGKAGWDGVQYRVTSESAFDVIGKHLRLKWADADATGSQPALSIRVRIVDPQGQVLIERFGGLGALFRIEGGKLQPLDGSDCFTERARAPRAVHAALDRLVDEAPYPRIPRRKLR